MTVFRSLAGSLFSTLVLIAGTGPVAKAPGEGGRLVFVPLGAQGGAASLAFESCLRAAGRGDVSAQTELAMLMEEGDGLPKDLAGGNSQAAQSARLVGQGLTPAQVQEAQRRAGAKRP